MEEISFYLILYIRDQNPFYVLANGDEMVDIVQHFNGSDIKVNVAKVPNHWAKAGLVLRQMNLDILHNLLHLHSSFVRADNFGYL